MLALPGLAGRFANPRWRTAAMTKARVLMCPPVHFNVDYEINPWMQGNLGAVSHDLALRQWEQLREVLAREARIELVAPRAGLPDMVFTANAGLVFGRQFVPSNFAHPERQGEREYFARWFAAAGYTVLDMPHAPGDYLAFEGAGDALYSTDAPVLWVGHGFRTDARAPAWLAQHLDVEVVALRLVDPRYYHLDTCFCPLADGVLLWNPGAFDAQSRAAVEARVPAHKRIAVGAEDAAAFACNAVGFDDVVVVNQATPGLTQALQDAGLRVVATPLSEFMKSGGAAKCLTLRLDTEALDWFGQASVRAAAAA